MLVQAVQSNSWPVQCFFSDNKYNLKALFNMENNICCYGLMVTGWGNVWDDIRLWNEDSEVLTQAVKQLFISINN